MLLTHLPRESATMQAVLGPVAMWGHEHHLLADIVDVLQAANWQRIGKRSAPRPKPVSRPGVTPQGTKRHGGKRSFEMDELDAIVAERFGGREVEPEPTRRHRLKTTPDSG